MQVNYLKDVCAFCRVKMDEPVDCSLISGARNKRGFEEECDLFRRKYNLDFGEFEKRFVDAKEEKFQAWDDYMAWKFAENCRKRQDMHG